MSANLGFTPGNLGPTTYAAPPPAAPGYGRQVGPFTIGGPAAGNDLQNQALLNDPNTLRAYMYSKMGLDPGDPGYYSDLLDQVFLPVFSAAAALYGLGGSSGPLAPYQMNTMGDFGKLAQMATGVGGGFFGVANQMGAAIAQDPRFQAAMRALAGTKGVAAAQKEMQNVGVLTTAGQNPLIQQATNDTLQRAAASYPLQAFNTLAPGAAKLPQGGYYGWLQSQRSNPQFNYLAGLLGG